MARQHHRKSDPVQSLARRASTARALLVLIVGLAWLWPLQLWAQDDPQRKAAAEMLFREGRKLLFHGEYKAACQRFEQSQALDQGVGTLLYLAECYDRLGRPASAWATYRSAESIAKAAGQADRARVAGERAIQLEPTLPKLAVDVADENPSEGFALTIDGKPFDKSLFGVAFPIDPGRHELVAQAFGRAPWATSIDILPGQAQTVRVPVLEPARTVQTLPASDPYGIGAAPRDDAVMDTGSNLASSPRQKASFIVAAGGAAALATGIVLGLVAKGKDDDATGSCTGGCADPARAEGLNESARDWALGANIAYGVGALGLVTAGVLYFWPDQASATASRRSVIGISPRLAPNGALLTVGGVL
jgi:serine/threonine-protein kinase